MECFQEQVALLVERLCALLVFEPKRRWVLFVPALAAVNYNNTPALTGEDVLVRLEAVALHVKNRDIGADALSNRFVDDGRLYILQVALDDAPRTVFPSTVCANDRDDLVADCFGRTDLRDWYTQVFMCALLAIQ